MYLPSESWHWRVAEEWMSCLTLRPLLRPETESRPRRKNKQNTEYNYAEGISSQRMSRPTLDTIRSQQQTR